MHAVHGAVPSNVPAIDAVHASMCPAVVHALPSHSSFHPKIKYDLFPFCVTETTQHLVCHALEDLKWECVRRTCLCKRSDSISAIWSISNCSVFAGVVVFAIFVAYFLSLDPVSIFFFAIYSLGHNKFRRTLQVKLHQNSRIYMNRIGSYYLIDGVVCVSMAIVYPLPLHSAMSFIHTHRSQLHGGQVQLKECLSILCSSFHV